MAEIFKLNIENISDSKEFKKKISLIESSSMEIDYYIKEFIYYLDNSWRLSKENIMMQRKFKDIYSHYIKKSNHDYLHGSYLSTISNKFLKNNKYFLRK